MDEAPANAVEAIVKDGVEDQRKAGVMPRPNEVKAYVQGVVERMERRDEEARLRIKPKAAVAEVTKERSSAEMESEYVRRCRRVGIEPTPGKWTVTRAPITDEPKQPSLLEVDGKRRALQKRRLRARLRLLRSKPDWAAKLKAINPLALQGQLGPEKHRQAEHLVKEVIRASDAVFGPWMKGPAKKLWFT